MTAMLVQIPLIPEELQDIEVEAISCPLCRRGCITIDDKEKDNIWLCNICGLGFHNH
jgi:ribosomal protein L37AE/L43A